MGRSIWGRKEDMGLGKAGNKGQRIKQLGGKAVERVQEEGMWKGGYMEGRKRGNYGTMG